MPADRRIDPPALSVSLATVRDYCDSAERFPQLCVSNDLKDVQRPWTLKALLGRIPRGARLLEIGAGEPLVAHALTEAGYQVTVCDPYDGSGNGPTEYEAYRSRYPRISFARNQFTIDAVRRMKWTGAFDAVYSISVLEHIQPDDRPGVFGAIPLALAPGGVSLHCVDTVVAGNGDDWHRDMVARVIALHQAIAGIRLELADAASLAADLFRRANEDIEVFIMGPQGHNLWRGGVPYEKFPFRRCASVEVIATSGPGG